jgi:flagellar biosynthesis/type III secretory pathway ATPase
MSQVASAEHKEAAALLREVLATYANARDLVNIGAYVSGSNPAVDYALAAMPRVREYLRQVPEELSGYEPAVKALRDLFDLPHA